MSRRQMAFGRARAYLRTAKRDRYGQLPEQALRKAVDIVVRGAGLEEWDSAAILRELFNVDLGGEWVSLSDNKGKRSVKNNPTLAIVGTNPPNVMSHDVLAVVYAHVGDGPDTLRVHTFGRGGRFRNNADGSVTIWPAESSGVLMEASKNLRVISLVHRQGKPLAGDF